MPTPQNREMVKVEIPESFRWVYDYWRLWWEESRTGQFTYDFKDGGIASIIENIRHCKKRIHKNGTKS